MRRRERDEAVLDGMRADSSVMPRITTKPNLYPPHSLFQRSGKIIPLLPNVERRTWIKSSAEQSLSGGCELDRQAGAAALLTDREAI